MILVYSKHTSNRLTYTLDVLFKYILKTDYEIVSLEVFEKASEKTKLNYSDTQIEDCISIVPNALLFEKDIQKKEINVDWIDELPFFFKTSENATFEYDLLASSFYLISRYEEYYAKDLDEHRRFKAENSIAFQNDFLEIPVVNLWALQLKNEILKINSEFHFENNSYTYLNSLDIDFAYRYKGKPASLLFMGMAKALLTFNFEELKTYSGYLFSKNEDPYDSYNTIENIQKEYATTNSYFFLLGNRSKYDKNLPYNSKELQKLIQRISKHNSIGIHPSYLSNSDKKILQLEIQRLENILGKKVAKSRQHFLKLEFPKTYESLISSDIKEDFSMGYASQIGFRAGICTSYPFFNLLKNEERDLRITPFQLMDVTLNFYLKLTPEEAIEKIKSIVKITKEVDGFFVSLWHNSSLVNSKEWANWTSVYKSMVAIAKED